MAPSYWNVSLKLALRFAIKYEVACLDICVLCDTISCEPGQTIIRGRVKCSPSPSWCSIEWSTHICVYRITRLEGCSAHLHSEILLQVLHQVRRLVILSLHFEKVVWHTERHQFWLIGRTISDSRWAVPHNVQELLLCWCQLKMTRFSFAVV